MTVVALLELTVKPDVADTAASVITETLTATRAFAGSLGVDVVVDEANPLHYILIERWESLEADAAYRAWRATPEGASRLGEIVAERKLTMATLHDDI